MNDKKILALFIIVGFWLWFTTVFLAWFDPLLSFFGFLIGIILILRALDDIDFLKNKKKLK